MCTLLNELLLCIFFCYSQHEHISTKMFEELINKNDLESSFKKHNILQDDYCLPPSKIKNNNDYKFIKELIEGPSEASDDIVSIIPCSFLQYTCIHICTCVYTYICSEYFKGKSLQMPYGPILFCLSPHFHPHKSFLFCNVYFSLSFLLTFQCSSWYTIGCSIVEGHKFHEFHDFAETTKFISSKCDVSSV